MNEIINQIIQRKSIRQFTEQLISKEDKDLILEAAFNAPTAGNMQLYSIIDVTDQTIKEKLSVLCDNQPFIKQAKMVLVFVADYTKWFDCFNNLDLKPRAIAQGDLLLAIEDTMIAAENSVMAAQSLGIGSCFIGDVMENGEKMVELLRLPEHAYPACMVVYGYPTEPQKNRIKPKRLDKQYVVCKCQYKIVGL